MSDIPPGRLQRTAALLVMLLAMALTVVSVHYGSQSIRAGLAIVPAFGGIICFVNLFTAIVLVGQARPGQVALAAKLAAAYLFSGLVVIPNLLSFPGLFTDGFVIGDVGTATWQWLGRDTGFALFVMYFALTAKSTKRSRARGFSTLAMGVGAAAFVVVVATWGLPYLPVVTDGTDFYRLNALGIGPLVVICNLAALFLVVRRLRASNTVDLWLAVALGVACLDITIRLIGGARFTAGWYCGQVLALVGAMTVFLAMLFESMRVSALKTELTMTLERLSLTDPLTELPNRRAFDQAFNAEWRRADREALPVSVLMIDIDHFKGYNDSLGHPAGDRCLRLVAWALGRMARRPYDLSARLGGEEFAVLLPNTDAAGAVKIGEKVRASIASLRIVHPSATRGIVTVSIGVATGFPTDPTLDPALLLDRADQALYRAKQSGRNKVTIDDHVTVVAVSPDLSIAIGD
jgi:diguanylate cyclase (GGDEF)-like protein